MMTGAYFVGRKELLAWVNDLLSVKYNKVEELCSGSAYCQILDALAPGKVNLKRVNFKVRLCSGVVGTMFVMCVT